MPITISPIRKAKVKAALLKGASASQALREAGYSANSALHSTDMTVIKCNMAEIQEDLTAKDITVDHLIKKTERIVNKAFEKEDYTNSLRGIEDQARFVGIDKPIIIGNVWSTGDVNILDADSLTKLAKNRIK